MSADPAVQKIGTATPYGDLQPVERMARRRPHVVIVGAGWGGLTLARQLRSVSVDVELIDRNTYRAFSPFVYQVAAGMLSPGDVAPSVRSLISSAARSLQSWAWMSEPELQSWPSTRTWSSSRTAAVSKQEQ